MKMRKFFKALELNLDSCFPGEPDAKEFNITIGFDKKKKADVTGWKNGRWLFTARFSGTKLKGLEVDPYFSRSVLWRDHISVCLLASQFDEDMEKDPERWHFMFLGSFPLP